MQSMTGFHREEASLLSSHCYLELKSLNHRFLDIRCRLHPQFAFLEPLLQEIIRKHFSRGSFDVSLKNQTTDAKEKTTVDFTVNLEALKSFQKAVSLASKTLKKDLNIDLASLLTTQEIIVVDETPLEEDKLADQFAKLFNKACEGLKKQRESEGTKLKVFFEKNLKELESHSQELTKIASTLALFFRNKLMDRIQKWNLASENKLDTQRLEYEVAYYVDRSDVSEELTRLSAHLLEYKNLLKSKDPIGKKLDFLTQELNREVNTIGSKANDLKVTQVVLKAKHTIEQLREQVQNVE